MGTKDLIEELRAALSGVSGSVAASEDEHAGCLRDAGDLLQKTLWHLHYLDLAHKEAKAVIGRGVVYSDLSLIDAGSAVRWLERWEAL